jgi:hypothetical protein
MAGIFQPRLALSIKSDTLTLVIPEYEAAGLRFVRYQLDDAAAPSVLSNCLNNALDYGGPTLAALGETIIVAGDATAIGNGPVMQEVIEVNTTCENAERGIPGIEHLVLIRGSRSAPIATTSWLLASVQARRHRRRLPRIRRSALCALAGRLLFAQLPR